MLRNWWNEFNFQYFGCELPMPNRFEITNSKRIMGQFSANCFLSIIRISVYYDRDEHGYQETLLHEMIHQWQYVRHLPIDHKINFKRKAAQINCMGGWDIQRTTNVNEGVADGIKEKKHLGPAYLVKFTRNGNTPAFAFATTNLWKKIASSQYSVNLLKTNPYYGGDIEVYYLKNKPDSCAHFLVNRKKLKNYNLDRYEETMKPVFSAAQRVAF